MLLNPKKIFLFILSVGLLPLVLCAQEKKPIPLNMHFFETLPGDATQLYYKISSYSPDSVKIERIFDLKNRLIRIDRIFPPENESHLITVEKYDTLGNLSSKTSANLSNSKFITTYFQKSKQVAQVMYRGEHKYTIFRNGYEKPIQTLENDFEPRPNEEKKDFGFFLQERTKFSKGEWPSIRHHVVIGVLVSETGEIREVVWANPFEGEKRVANHYLKAFLAWKKGFLPAKDHEGQPISSWKYYHFYPGGRLENTQMIVKFNVP